jgi:hypothetical protein
MPSVTDILRAEKARLENHLARVNALLEVYEPGGSEPRLGNGAVQSRPIPRRPDRENSKEERVRRAIKEFLAQHGGSAHRGDILKHVVSLGIMGHEKRPLKTMGVYLTKFKADVCPSPDAVGFWQLREPGQ